MKIFQMYVLKSFLKFVIIVELFVTLMSAISSTMGESKDLAAFDYSLSDFALLQLYNIALNMNITMPIVTTVAALIVIILLMRSNELLAYVSLGGTVLSLAVPFITIGIMICGGMIFWEYKVMPESRIAREELRQKMKGATYNNTATYTNVWMMDGPKKLININLIDMLGGKINDITEYTIDNRSSINQISKISTAVKDNNTWQISEQHITDIRTNPPVITTLPPANVSNKLWDDLMKVAVVDVRALSLSQLKLLSNIMDKYGTNTGQYDLLYYSKIANAVSVIVLLILTFPLAINFSRNYSIIKNTIIPLSLGLTFWIVQASSYSLGKTGQLSPFLATFLPIFIFIILSAVIIYRREYKR